MSAYQWLSLLSVPSLLAALVGYLLGRLKKVKQSNEALKLGVQALLRSQMIRDYNKYSDLGHAPLYAKENFENCWQQYHALGANGVMNDIHAKFLALPTR